MPGLSTQSHADAEIVRRARSAIGHKAEDPSGREQYGNKSKNQQQPREKSFLPQSGCNIISQCSDTEYRQSRIHVGNSAAN